MDHYKTNNQSHYKTNNAEIQSQIHLNILTHSETSISLSNKYFDLYFEEEENSSEPGGPIEIFGSTL